MVGGRRFRKRKHIAGAVTNLTPLSLKKGDFGSGADLVGGSAKERESIDQLNVPDGTPGSADRMGREPAGVESPGMEYPPEQETLTMPYGRCVPLDENGNPPPGEALFRVHEIPNPFRMTPDISTGGPT